jgi:hypothetical protein
MNSSIFAPLTSLDGVRLQPGADEVPLDELERALGGGLPTDHRTALSQSNGAQVYGGYLTLFGIGPESIFDMAKWNDPKCWKFAWGNHCSEYWCFAETAWGDQYSYNILDLREGYSQVYLLDFLSMSPTLVASGFSDFFEAEFIECAKDPYDTTIKEARQELGDLQIGEHLIYLPSPLLGGKEEISNVIKMGARTAMICNGDIARQLNAGPMDGNVKGITPYEDSEGRMRLELNWA